MAIILRRDKGFALTFDELDDNFAELSGGSSLIIANTAPLAPSDGQMWLDTGITQRTFAWSVEAGGVWLDISPSNKTTISETEPLVKNIGDGWFDTSAGGVGSLVLWNGTSWVEVIGTGGGGGSTLSPTTAPDWASPDATISTTSTWNKPAAITDSTWVWFYGVGGGNGANGWSHVGGDGGDSHIIGMPGSQVPATISFTVGAGGISSFADFTLAQIGGDTTATIGTHTLNTGSGTNEIYSGAFVDENDISFTGGSTIPLTLDDQDFDGGKGGRYSTTITSTYAGDGGLDNGASGVVPGGGGGSNMNGNSNQQVSSGNGPGAAGNVRIYWTTGQ